MKVISFAAMLFILGLPPVAFGQQAKLEGKVADDKGLAVAGVRMSAPGGQANETDSLGHFVISFPTSIRPGQATRLDIDKPRWVIYEPMLGECVTQSAPRNFEPLKVIIVEKHSPLALSPKRLSQVIARLAKERVQLRNQVTEQKNRLDEYAFLQEYADKYGITLEQFADAADRWVKIKEANNKGEQALKEYWLKNYDRAALLAHEAGLGADAQLEEANKSRLEAGRKVIHQFRLEGNARFAQYKFREALAAYNEIEKRFSSRKISKEDLPEEWAETKNLIGIAKFELGIRVVGQESRLLLDEAVADYREALKVYTRNQSPRAWAGLHNNLGMTLMMQGGRFGGEESLRLLSEAVAASHEALNITREQFPMDWADTQITLGNALTAQGARSAGEVSLRRLNEAVGAFREAFRVHTREQSPQGWATAQNNLGMALRLLGERAAGGEGARLLAEAVGACQEALKVRTRELSPQGWADAQSNLGNALVSLGVRSSGEESRRLLAEAVAANREALKVYIQEQTPHPWADTQTNLGIALMEQGERARGKESQRLLSEAVAAFRDALKVYTHEHSPQDRAATLISHGAALGLQGERSSGEEGLRLLAEAVATLREALKVTREQLPQDLARAQIGLGVVLTLQGERFDGEEGLRLLAEAIAAFREALKVYTREQSPQTWAEAQCNLGSTFRLQGMRSSEKDKEDLRLLFEAVTAYREALKVYTREQSPQAWAATMNNLGVTLSLVGERTTGEECLRLLDIAVSAHREALKVFTREQSPLDWADTQNELGNALRLQGERSTGEDSRRFLSEAVGALQEALIFRTSDQSSQAWVTTRNNLARSYYLLGDWKNAVTSYAEIIASYPHYEEGYRRMALLYHEQLFEYDKAFEQHSRWLSIFPDDVLALAHFAEAHFTTGRFDELPQHIKALLTKSDLPAETKAALQMIEAANFLALDKTDQALSVFDSLLKTIADQRIDFRMTWSFNGALRFINRGEKLAKYRVWLNKFFAAAEEENRDALMKKLREARAEFKADVR